MTDQIQIIKPFGPTIAKFIMPQNLIENLNKYVDDMVLNEEKLKNLNHGHRLAGNVTQEFKLESDFIKSSGLLDLLGKATISWVNATQGKKSKKFTVVSSWIVRQLENEFNPIHHHGGHLSGVGYLKMPKNLGSTVQKEKKHNYNGQLSLIHGSTMFNCNSTFNITPKVGEFYIFPNYLLHTVYPFYGKDEERRSISFNALIDEDIYDVYSSSAG